MKMGGKSLTRDRRREIGGISFCFLNVSASKRDLSLINNKQNMNRNSLLAKFPSLCLSSNINVYHNLIRQHAQSIVTWPTIYYMQTFGERFLFHFGIYCLCCFFSVPYTSASQHCCWSEVFEHCRVDVCSSVCCCLSVYSNLNKFAINFPRHFCVHVFALACGMRHAAANTKESIMYNRNIHDVWKWCWCLNTATIILSYHYPGWWGNVMFT